MTYCALSKMIMPQSHIIGDVTIAYTPVSTSNRTRRSIIISIFHALGPKGSGLRTFLPKTGLQLGGFKDTTLNY